MDAWLTMSRPAAGSSSGADHANGQAREMAGRDGIALGSLHAQTVTVPSG